MKKTECVKKALFHNLRQYLRNIWLKNAYFKLSDILFIEILTENKWIFRPDLCVRVFFTMPQTSFFIEISTENNGKYGWKRLFSDIFFIEISTKNKSRIFFRKHYILFQTSFLSEFSTENKSRIFFLRKSFRHLFIKISTENKSWIFF